MSPSFQRWPGAEEGARTNVTRRNLRWERTEVETSDGRLEAEGHVTSNLRESERRGKVDGESNVSRLIESNRAVQTDATESRMPLQVQKYLDGWKAEASFSQLRIQLIRVNLALLLRILTPSVREMFHLQIIFTQS